MYSMMKTKIHILVPLLLATVFLLGVFLFFPTSSYPPLAAAQEPDRPFDEETLRALDLTLPPIEAADTSFDLGVVKTASASSVVSGERVTFTISITNGGPDPAYFITFEDVIPAQMQDVEYEFSKSVYPDEGDSPLRLITEPIIPGETVLITVTGILTSGPDITVINTAILTTDFFPEGETNTENNSDQAEVSIIGSSPFQYFYLPIIFKTPPPPTVLVYHEDFDSGEPWLEFDSNGCKTETRDGKFRVDVDQNDRSCLPPADDDSYRTYGEFQVTAYHSEDLTGSGDRSNAAYGLFINGQGGENYYLFRIWPNNGCSTGGSWQLIRRRNDNESTLRSGSCEPAINRGGSQNILKIAHKDDRTLSVYVNGTLLGSYSDSSSNHLTGVATGVYVRSDDEDVRIKFDDFKVYRYN